jgi:hypothetical protein
MDFADAKAMPKEFLCWNIRWMLALLMQETCQNVARKKA